MTQTQPQLRSTSVPTRTFQLRRIHELARQAGFVTLGKEGDPRRERYERFLSRTISRTSTRQATRTERELVISELRKMIDAGYRMANARPLVAYSDADCEGLL